MYTEKLISEWIVRHRVRHSPWIQDQESFENFTKMIMSPKSVKTSSWLLAKLCQKDQPRIFLSAFLIHHYPEVLNNPQNEIDQMVLNTVEKIYRHYTMYGHTGRNLDLFHLKWNIYKFFQIFPIWKAQDLVGILNYLSKSYHELESIYTDILDAPGVDADTVQTWHEQIKKQQTQLKNMIRSVGGSYGLEYLEQFNELYSTLRNMMHRAFWDKLKNELSDGQYDSLLPILDDISLRLRFMTPNNPERMAEIDQTLDLESVKKFISEQTFTSIDLSRLISGFYDLFAERVAPVKDAELREFRDKYQVLIDEGYEPGQIAQILEDLHHFIDSTVRDVNAYKIMQKDDR